MDQEAEGADWRDRFLVEFFNRERLPFLSAGELVRRDARLRGRRVADYFLQPPNSHPNELQIALVASELQRQILATRW